MTSIKNFAMVGVSGYVAPRHLQAIKDTGNRLLAAYDPHDSVGVLDRFFLESVYFREFELFDRHIEKLRSQREDERVQYISICSPNYLHDAHIRFAMRVGADAICEKPLVLNPWNCLALKKIEQETGRRVYTVMQLRLHPTIQSIRKLCGQLSADQKRYKVKLTNITPRGRWYLYSWKGNIAKSGGLVTNIGIHFFDMLVWVFGKAKASNVFQNEPTRAKGFLELERADVEWQLSIDPLDMPEGYQEKGLTAIRKLEINGQNYEFADGFSSLHTQTYREILAGRGFGIDDVFPSIQLVSDIRQAKTGCSSSQSS